MTYTFSIWPGIERASDAFLGSLARGCIDRGWSYDDLAGHISHESGFNPGAKNPGASASGLIQIIDSEAKKLGTTATAIRAMSSESQLPYIFRYFERYGRAAMSGADYQRAGFGNYAASWDRDTTLPLVNSRGQNVSKGTAEYDLNSALDFDRDGTLTVSDIEASFQRYKAKYAGKTRLVSSEGETTGGGFASVMLVLGAFALGFFTLKRG